MNLLLNRKKGAVLLQTLVMVVLLSMIAVMIIKWTMGRYILVNQAYQSASGTAAAQADAAKNQMTEMSFTQTTPQKHVFKVVNN